MIARPMVCPVEAPSDCAMRATTRLAMFAAKMAAVLARLPSGKAASTTGRAPMRADGSREPSAAVGVDKRRQRLGDASMIAVEPGGLLRREQPGHDQLPVDRCKRERLECVERFLGAGYGRGGDHQHQILDADA